MKPRYFRFRMNQGIYNEGCVVYEDDFDAFFEWVDANDKTVYNLEDFNKEVNEGKLSQGLYMQNASDPYRGEILEFTCRKEAPQVRIGENCVRFYLLPKTHSEVCQAYYEERLAIRARQENAYYSQPWV